MRRRKARKKEPELPATAGTFHMKQPLSALGERGKKGVLLYGFGDADGQTDFPLRILPLTLRVHPG